MKNKLFQIGFKIIIITIIFFVIINYFGNFLNAGNFNKADIKENKKNFVSNDIQIVGNVAVAITTNIGTRHKQLKEVPVNIYKDVIDIGFMLSNQKEVQDKIIASHMNIINEYFNILKTDIRALLSSSNDRSFALNSFIAQLEYRYKVGIENSKTLVLQRQELLKIYDSSNTQIENIKNKIGVDFSNFNSKATLVNIDEYLKLREQNLTARTYIIFINKFLNYYSILNNYNKKLLDTLINNKEILIKNTQVVIPDTGGDLLKDLKLIYDEEEWKQK